MQQLANFRDVGGLRAADGRCVRRGVLYRGDATFAGDGPPVGAISWPPAVVLDLRSEGERRSTSPWPSGTTVHEIALLAELGSALRGVEEVGTLRGLYLELVRQSTAQLAQIVQLVATSSGPILLHCALGKDRTGVAVAAVLLAVDVEPEMIVADYELTAPNVAKVLWRLRALGVEVPPDDELPHQALAVDTAALRAVLEEISSAPGGARGWLRRHGVSEADFEALEHKLLG